MNFSQRDSRWASLKINGTSSTMSSYGCFVTSLAMLCDTLPSEVLRKLEKGGGLNGDMIIAKKACQILDLDYIDNGDARLISPQPLKLPCITEVDFSPAEGKQTHFVVYLGKNRIIDSFDGKEKNCPYSISNYRNIFAKDKKEAVVEETPVIEIKDDRKERELKELEDLKESNELKDSFKETTQEVIKEDSEALKKVKGGAWVTLSGAVAGVIISKIESALDIKLGDEAFVVLMAILTGTFSAITKYLNRVKK